MPALYIKFGDIGLILLDKPAAFMTDITDYKSKELSMEKKIEQVKEESQSKMTFLRHKLHAKNSCELRLYILQ